MTIYSTHCSRRFRSLLAAVGVTVLALFAGSPNRAAAHSFIVTLDATAADQPLQLKSAIQGMRLAAGERDSHAAETSDGHLGGIDLFIRVKPPEAAEGITWLKGAPDEAETILVVFSEAEFALSQRANVGAVVIRPGTLPPERTWSADASALAIGFFMRFQEAYGSAPDRQAAQGYNVAIRIDRAVRALGGVQDTEGLQHALDYSDKGIDWD